MKIAIIGTGNVGRTLAAKLVELGHDVMVGTRNVQEKLAGTENDSYGNPPFSVWLNNNRDVKLGTFAEAATHGEMVFNATHGESSVTALILAGTKNLAGKILVDVANPLDFSKGMPPSLLPGLCNTNSLGEEIQRTFCDSFVVKTLNTMWCGLMVNPQMIGKGDHINFISGNSVEAKTEVRNLLRQFGWKDENLVDLGNISAARATESMLLIWLSVMSLNNNGVFNFKIVR